MLLACPEALKTSEAQGTVNGWTALTFAAVTDNAAVVRLLSSPYVDVEAVRHRRKPAMWHAKHTRRKHPDVIAALSHALATRKH